MSAPTAHCVAPRFQAHRMKTGHSIFGQRISASMSRSFLKKRQEKAKNLPHSRYMHKIFYFTHRTVTSAWQW
jgi:hypothetical protein